jgi:transposase
MQESLFTTVHLETFVPADHPLRPIRAMANEALGRMSWLFDAMYAEGGSESIPPERLVRAMLLQVLYSVRSERHLMEQLNYNLLFRRFMGLAIDDPVWDHSVFSKNRERLMEHGVVEMLFDEILAQAEREDWLSREHFPVDGTLVRAWASHKSFRPRDGGDDEPPTGGGRNAPADFRGQKRCNDTHASTTDPDALLYRKSKGTPSMMCYPRASGDREPQRLGRACGGQSGRARIEHQDDVSHDLRPFVMRTLARPQHRRPCGRARRQPGWSTR